MAFDPSTVISARLDRLAAIAELIYFPDDVIAEHERRPAAHRLWVEVPSDHRVRVRQARGEHAYSHLAPPGCRQRGRHSTGGVWGGNPRVLGSPPMSRIALRTCRAHEHQRGKEIMSLRRINAKALG